MAAFGKQQDGFGRRFWAQSGPRGERPSMSAVRHEPSSAVSLQGGFEGRAGVSPAPLHDAEWMLVVYAYTYICAAYSAVQ
jgi:hypothetical protein